ncbi:uncharacterized protein BO87DRAFT_412232 [Aspergillus neoniger CBS 115656]|uniref:Fungal STAND N-terminal Goodbye domain-containing protein n=1 Tax=Aspergillus neoniger (strain CBS 115656) TaxID=1448310 RepID=A0A318YXH2_ASPNB|nr:hypothetical protein BO87DRAFT_412232 [Aspergillus neoniger CBS 115656]PYH39336.1 hypothetical protein BO87DRAFT_412232 [Aspergillus neoniger CBS 115656]
METQSRQDVQKRLKSIQRLMKETCAQFEKITKRRLESRRFEDVKSFEDLMKKSSSGEKGDDDESRETRQKFLTIVSTIQTLTGPLKSATDIAFSPASACVSALSFILEIPSKVHGIHESIRAVIDEVEPRFSELRAAVIFIPKASKLLERMGGIDQERQGKVLVRLASLAGDKEQAFQYLKQALELWSHDCREELSDLVIDTLKLRMASGPMGHLGLVIQMAIEDSDYDDTQMMNLPYTISSICSSSADNFAFLLGNIQTAIENAKAQNRVKTWTTLLLQKGMAYACYSDDPSHADQAVKAWTECAETIINKLKYLSAGAILLDRVGRQLGCYYFTQTLKDPDNAEIYSQKLKETYLAADFIRHGKQPEAEALFQANIRDAFDLLPDDTTGNYVGGLIRLVQIFLYTGDRVNFLNAYSLIARRVLDVETLEEWLRSDEKTTTPEATELMDFFQENCNKPISVWYKLAELVQFMRRSRNKLMNETPWSDDDAANMKSYEALFESMKRYAEALSDARYDYSCDACECVLDTNKSMYACKFCFDFALCELCFHRFQHGALKMSLCHIEHDYVRIPPWDAKAHVRAFQRRVLIDATVADDGYLVGGREVPVVEWLNCLKAKWDPQGD